MYEFFKKKKKGGGGRLPCQISPWRWPQTLQTTWWAAQVLWWRWSLPGIRWQLLWPAESYHNQGDHRKVHLWKGSCQTSGTCLDAPLGTELREGGCTFTTVPDISIPALSYDVTHTWTNSCSSLLTSSRPPISSQVMLGTSTIVSLSADGLLWLRAHCKTALIGLALIQPSASCVY